MRGLERSAVGIWREEGEKWEEHNWRMSRKKWHGLGERGSRRDFWDLVLLQCLAGAAQRKMVRVDDTFNKVEVLG